MKFLRLDLQKFGPFSDVVLDFSERPRALHVIVGSNAVGKSTSLRATVDLLFGIPATTRDAHTHEMPDLRIGGLIAAEDGQEVALSRRKGNKNTLTDAAGQPIDESQMRTLVGGLGREQFEAMFSLSHQGLIEGGRALLQGKGDVGESLFSAGLGGLGVHHLLKQLENKAESIFKPGGKNPPLNRAITLFKEAKKSASELCLQTKEWEALQEDLKAQHALSQQIEVELRELRADERRLRRIDSALGPVAHRDELEALLEAQRQVVELPETAAEERRRAQKALGDAALNMARIEAELDDLRAKMSALTVPEALLSREAAMKQLRNDLGSHLKAENDLPRRRAELRLVEEDAQNLLRQLGASLSLDAIESLRLKSTVVARLSALGKQRGKLESTLVAAKQTQIDVDDKRQHLQSKRERLPVARDAERLRRAVDLARKEGDLEKREREQHAACEALRIAVAQGHRGLGLWQGSIDAIGSLAMPVIESIQRAEQSASELKNELAKQATRAEDRQAKIAQIAEQLEVQKRSGPVPTEEDLASARDERTQSWGLVRRAWLEAAVDAPRPASDLALARAHEGHTRHADDLADRLRREADRVAEFASLLSRQAAEARALAKLETHRESLEAQQAADLSRWVLLWAPLGITPLSPPEMRSWLQRYGQLTEERMRWLDAQRALDGLRAQIASHRQALAREIAATEGALSAAESDEEGGATLPVLLARAEGMVRQADAIAREHESISQASVALEGDAAKALGAVVQHGAALDAWNVQWAELCATLGLDANALPEEAEKVVEQRKELLSKAEARASLRHRVTAMEADTQAFSARVAELVESTAPDLRDRNVGQAAEALLERFDLGGKQRVVRTQVEQRHAHATEDHAGLVRTHDQAEREIARLVTQARCTTVDDLPAAEQAAEAVRALKRKRDEVETVLRNVAQGTGIEALVAECRAQHADEVFSALRAREGEIQALEQKRRAPEQAIGMLNARKEAMDGSDRAAIAAESAQHAMACIRTHVEDYARARLASVVLREEINRYRARNQGPIVSRASTLFQRLTRSTFSGLEIAYDDQDAPMIRCVRDTDQRVTVEGLSDGTRDQLFLSLRVASMERHLEHNEPVPVIVDDALINFDDRRARAALSVLGDLASRTQIIFFTHHQHLADLATESVAAEVLVRHDLDRLTGAGGA